MNNEAIDKLRCEGLGYRKIANILGLSEGVVRGYCYRHPLPIKKNKCLECGKSVLSTPQKKEKKFCSDKCRMKWWNSHKDLVKKKAIYKFVCKHCGCEFESYGNKNRKYCSRRCFANARRKEDLSSE